MKKTNWNLGWYFLASLLFALLDYVWAEPSGGILRVILGGIESWDGEIQPLAVGRWLFIFGFMFLIAGLELGRAKKMLVFECYRYGSFGRWWFMYYRHILCLIMILYMEIIAVWCVLEKITERHTQDYVWIFVTFGIHMGLLVTIDVAFDIILKRGVIAVVLLVAEGMGYIIAEQTDISWVTGGMYIRSKMCLENGFSLPIMYFIEGILMALCVMGIVWMGRCGRLGNSVFGKEE